MKEIKFRSSLELAKRIREMVPQEEVEFLSSLDSLIETLTFFESKETYRAPEEVSVFGFDRIGNIINGCVPNPPQAEWHFAVVEEFTLRKWR